MKRALLITWMLIGNLMLTIAQDRVRGRVMDSGKQPVVGASIIGSEGNTLALTDTLGYFSLIEPILGKITVSHVSFVDSEIEILAGQTGLLEIVLETNETFIEEVEISTGFQQIPKERATGAFSHIDNETFNEQVSTDVLSRLEAVANGLNIERIATTSGDMGIRIRGVSTLSTGAMRSPLIILDNFPYTGDLTNINPNEVESVTLLKDAAAASIWGARAGNGVIVITTKRGKIGQPLVIDFNTNISISDKPDLGYYPLMTSADFIEAERFLFSNRYRFSDTAALRRPPFSPAYEIMFRQMSGEINQNESDALLVNLAKVDVRDQYLEHIYEPQVNQQYALTLQSGNENTAWHLATGYDKNTNTLGAKYDRFNINFKNTYTPFKFLEVHVGMMHTETKSDNGRNGYSPGGLPPYTALADSNGNALPVVRNFRQPFLDTLAQGILLDWNYYPLSDDRHIDNQSSLSHSLFNSALILRPFTWLAFDIKYQYGRQQIRNSFLKKQGSYEVRDLINQFSEISTTTGEVIYHLPRGAVLDLANENLRSHNIRGQFNLNQTWLAHEFSGLIGLEASYTNTLANRNRTYGFNPDILTFNQVDYLTRYPHFITGSNTLIPQGQGFSDRTQKFVSAFANAAYTYAGRYSLTLSGRRDASNQFGVHFRDRWNLLWSAGVSWDISEEPFFGINTLPYLRLRATYGFSGNTDLSRSAVATIYYSGTSPFLNAPMSYVSQDPNPELGWERVRMINIAADFRSKNSRFSGSVDFYFKRGTDLFGPYPIDYTTGISGVVIRNISSLSGRGFDANINTINIDRKWSWKSDLNFSFYTDRVTKYYNSITNMSAYIPPGSIARTLVEGERVYALYSYRWAGLDSQTGDPTGYIAGKTSTQYSAILGTAATKEDIFYHGSAVPLINGSFGNTLEFGEFGLTVRLLYKLGYYTRDSGVRYGTLLSGIGSATHAEYRLRWKQPGDEKLTNVPSFVYPIPSGRDNFYNLSEAKVIKGDHIRLQYISLYCNLTPSWLRKISIQRMRLYFNVSNIGVLWKAASETPLDPAFGTDNLPPAVAYSFGLRVNL